MSKAAHTPTPWEIRYTSGIDYYITSINHGKIVEYLHPNNSIESIDEHEDEMYGNAKLIITAVNHHQELVTRLQECVERMDKCRNILQNTAGNHAGNWGILDTSEARETLKKVIQ